ncbi:VCBS repeat-containing protein [Myxococcota bacterium]|nr:VCBS repeat-containing protein [Myxococcota bacterium]MBU1380638.1 VCBS repeat-containing protein [Myxococcota bacterium]MBU1496980.1 VCBS repeat-containing protein [Myxococcota bacterium]
MKNISKFFLSVSFSLLTITASCGRSDFDPSYIPDAGTDAADADADTDVIEGCGNGIRETSLGEECDNGIYNSNDPGASCRLDCLLARCGDGITDPLTEECDEGADNSNEPGATCRTGCTIGGCGDEILDPGEECDEGALNSDSPGAVCRTNCIIPGCGDGITDPGEQCDDANEVDTDACTNECMNATCGDGIIQADVEICDDGNTINDILCNADCTAGCGDGILEVSRGEKCDDGTSNNDSIAGACRTDCRPAHCGDGVWDPAGFCLSTPCMLPVSGTPVDLTYADMDGDGINDLILLSSSTIYVFAGTPTGYVYMWSRSGLTSPLSPVTGDFDDDGIKDIVIIETANRRMAFFKGAGNFTWGTPVRTTVYASTVDRAVAGDFDNDGIPEVAVLVPFADRVVFMKYVTSAFAVAGNLSTCQRPVAITKGFFDNNTSDDLAVACFTGGSVQIFKNNTGLTFNQVLLNATSYPKDLTAADVNGDGRHDLVLLKQNQSPTLPSITVYIAKTNGSFSPDFNLENLSSSSSKIAVADRDRDYHQDVILSTDTGFSIYSGDGSGNMSFHSQLAWPANPGNFIWSDVDGDGAADLFTAGGIANGFLTTDDPVSLPLPSALSIPAAALSATVADFNHDGIGDVAFATGDGRLFVLTGTSSGTFSVLTSMNISGISAVYSADLYNDSYPDLVILKSGVSTAEVYSNTSGTFTPAGTVSLGTSSIVKGISGYDFNGDMIPDIAFLTGTGNVVIVAGGSGSYQTHTVPVAVNTIDMTNVPSQTGVGDNLLILDNSNNIYTVVATDAENFVMASLGSITGNNTKIAFVENSSSTNPLLAAWDGTLGALQIWEYDTDHFTNNELVSTSCTVSKIVQGDHDQDGYSDLLLLCSDGLSIKYFHEGSDGEMTVHSRIRTTVYGSSFCTSGYLDTDNVPDLVCFNSNKMTRIITTP